MNEKMKEDGYCHGRMREERSGKTRKACSHCSFPFLVLHFGYLIHRFVRARAGWVQVIESKSIGGGISLFPLTENKIDIGIKVVKMENVGDTNYQKKINFRTQMTKPVKAEDQNLPFFSQNL